EVEGLIDAVVERIPADADLLELACGTGVWTERLARRARTLTAVDAAPEMIEIARARTDTDVRFVCTDVLGWQPSRRYDVVFFGFWLSHVPADRFAAFWTRLADCIVDGGQVVFVDEHVRHAPKESWLAREVAERTLADGTRHRIVKSYLDPSDVTARLAALGWHADVDELGDEWVIGQARLVRPAQVMRG
ncbi:MAG TPA: class I SAM-dependent methyltransferase, partial [Jatrophihabitantaceae bacterium]|nr:class I SAM-dependent methyltransferase [Jatrophihabitantaceae bacterium]